MEDSDAYDKYKTKGRLNAGANISSMPNAKLVARDAAPLAALGTSHGGWQKFHDQQVNKSYWYHAETGVTTWTQPECWDDDDQDEDPRAPSAGFRQEAQAKEQEDQDRMKIRKEGAMDAQQKLEKKRVQGGSKEMVEKKKKMTEEEKQAKAEADAKLQDDFDANRQMRQESREIRMKLAKEEKLRQEVQRQEEEAQEAAALHLQAAFQGALGKKYSDGAIPPVGQEADDDSQDMARAGSKTSQASRWSILSEEAKQKRRKRKAKEHDAFLKEYVAKQDEANSPAGNGAAAANYLSDAKRSDIDADEMRTMNFSQLQALGMSSSRQDYFPNSTLDTLDEALPLNLKGLPGLRHADLRQAFTELDFDRNGFLGVSELRFMSAVLGEQPTDEELDEMLRMVNCEGDGQASFQDFYGGLFTGKSPVPAEMAGIVQLLRDANKPIDEAKEQALEEQRAQTGKPLLDGPSVRDIDLMLKGASGFIYNFTQKNPVSKMPPVHTKRPDARRARPHKEHPPLALSPKAAKDAEKAGLLFGGSAAAQANKGKGKGKGGLPR